MGTLGVLLGTRGGLTEGCGWLYRCHGVGDAPLAASPRPAPPVGRARPRSGTVSGLAAAATSQSYVSPRCLQGVPNAATTYGDP